MAIAPPPGIYVPAVLFYKDDEDLDISSIKSHVLRLAQGGVTGILVQGSNGEAQHLSHDERALALKTTRETLDTNGYNNVLVIAGTGAQSARETIRLCDEAKEAGASYALVLTPSTWVPQMTRDNILRFHRKVADESPIPIMIYNFPVVTAGQDLDSDLLSSLAMHPNIVGTKLSCGNIGKLHRLTTKFSQKDFVVFAGKSDVYLPGLLCGSGGAIAALVNLFPKVHAHLYKLYLEGRVEEAMKMQALLGHGDWAVNRVGGIGGLKAFVSRYFQYGSGTVRVPLSPVSTELLQKVEEESVLLELLRLEKNLN